MLARLLFCVSVFSAAALAQCTNCLDVPFLSQVPPPDSTPPESIPAAVAWSNTHNCGQTSTLMVMAFHSHQTLSESFIRAADDYLALPPFDDPVNSYYGSFTGGTKSNRLVALAQSFDHGLGLYPDTSSHAGTMQELQTELGLNHPIIVGVWTNMCVRCSIRGIPTVPHWMVLTGMDSTYVYVNDPGHSNTVANHPKNHQYTLDAFNKAWADQGFAVVVIHPNAPTPPSATFTMSISGQPAVTSGSAVNASDTLMVTVAPGQVPIVSFDGSSSTGTGPLTFKWTSDGNVFPPSAPCTGPTCQFGLGAAGSPHTIALVVTDAYGQTSNVAVAAVNVTEATVSLPSASFTMTFASSSAANGQTLSVTIAAGGTALIDFVDTSRANLSGSTIAGWSWTVNGVAAGNSSSLAQMFTAGSFQVGLVVRDSAGNVSQAATGTIVVLSSDGSYSFTRLADDSLASQFGGLFNAAINDNGVVVFEAVPRSATQHGIFVTNGATTTTVADPSAPNSGFASVGGTWINNHNVVMFSGAEKGGFQDSLGFYSYSVYEWAGGVTSLTIDKSALPFANPTVGCSFLNDSGQALCTAGSLDGPSFGWYLLDNGLTPLPFNSSFSPIGLRPFNSQSHIMVEGYNADANTSDLYITDPIGTVIAQPGSQFYSVDAFYVLGDSDGVVFSARTAKSSGDALWLAQGATYSQVLAAGTVMDITADNRLLIETAETSLSTWAAGNVSPVISASDAVLGFPIRNFQYGQPHINNAGQIVFIVTGVDGTDYLYRADPN